MANVIKGTYFAGWITGVLALVWALLAKTGGQFDSLMRITARNWLELSVLCFLICVASRAYSGADQ